MTTARPSDNARNAVARRAQNAAAPQDDRPEPNAIRLVQQMRDTGEWQRALPASIITPERFTRVALTALRRNPDLLKCNRDSIIGSLVTAAQLGLEPNTPLGQCSLIPYKGECTLQIEYRGYVTLARRSGQIESVVARTVYENDEFDLAYGLDDRLVHKPAKGERGGEIGYYAVAKYVGGGYNFLYMTRAEVDAHRRKFSKQPNGPAWRDSFRAMAEKTVLRALFKFMPLSVELARADGADEQVRRTADLEDIDVRTDPGVIDAEPVDESGVNPASGEVAPADRQLLDADPVEVEDPPEHIAGWDTEDPQ